MSETKQVVGEAIRAGEAHVDLAPIKARLANRYGGGELWADELECVDITALLAEVERLRASSCSPEAETALKQWRSWANFVFLKGGPPLGTDAELQKRVCEQWDADVAASRSLETASELKRLRQENKTFECMLPPLHAKIAELKAQLAASDAPERDTRPERYHVEPDKDSDGDWHVVTFTDGRRVQIFTQHPLVIVDPETH